MGKKRNKGKNDRGVKLRPLLNELKALEREGSSTETMGEIPEIRFIRLQELIVKHRDRLNTVLADGSTPLVRAMKTGYLEAIVPMLRLGANPNQVLKSGEYINCSAFFAGLLHMLNDPTTIAYDFISALREIFIEAEDARNPINLNRIERLKLKNLSKTAKDYIRKLNSKPADTSNSVYWQFINNAITTPLLTAVSTKTFDTKPTILVQLVTLFLEKGADPNFTFVAEKYPLATPLILAVKSLVSSDENNKFPIIDALLSAGADPNTRTDIMIELGHTDHFNDRFKQANDTAYEASLLKGIPALTEQLDAITKDKNEDKLLPVLSHLILSDGDHGIIKGIIKSLEVDKCLPNTGNGEMTLFELAYNYKRSWLIHHLKSNKWNINFIKPTEGSLLHRVCAIGFEQGDREEHPVTELLNFGLDLGLKFKGKLPLEIALERRYLSGVIAMSKATDLSEFVLVDEHVGEISALHYIVLHYTDIDILKYSKVFDKCRETLTKDGDTAADLAIKKGKMRAAGILYKLRNVKLKPENLASLAQYMIHHDDAKGIKKVLTTNPNFKIDINGYVLHPLKIAALRKASNILQEFSSNTTDTTQKLSLKSNQALELLWNKDHQCYTASLIEIKEEDDTASFNGPLLLPTSPSGESGRAFCLARGIALNAQPTDTAEPAVAAEAVAAVSWLSSCEADTENYIRPMRNSNLPCFLFIDRNAVGDCPQIAQFEAVEAKFDHNHIKTLADSGLIVLVDGQPHPITHEIKLVGQKARLLCYSINEDGKTLLVAAHYAPKGLHTTADKASVSASLAAKELTQPQFAEASAGPNI